jgi:molybdate transport system ATP-binding protein
MPIRARIRARDVALAATRPTAISIRNIFPARILEIAPDRGALVDVRLDIGTAENPVVLWSRITARAARELGIEVGRDVYALVKTVALDRRSLGRHDPGDNGSDGEDSI